MLRALSYSSLVIGLCAFSLTLFYGELLDSIVLARSLLVGLATVAAYNFTQLVPLRFRDPINERGQWIKERSKGLWALSLLCLLLCAALSYYLSLKDWINFGHLFILCLVYENSFGNRPARKVPYIKPFYISYIWTMACCAPVIYDVGAWDKLGLVAECFFFMLSLCILFDLRDIKEDESLGFATLANRLELSQVKALSFALMALSLVYLGATGASSWRQIALYIGLYGLVVWRTKESSSEYFFLYLVDGMILVKALLL